MIWLILIIIKEQILIELIDTFRKHIIWNDILWRDNDYGLVFSIDTDGSGYQKLLDFNGTNGKYPYGSLTLSGNVLYGMTFVGGTNELGNVFSINTDGSGYNDLLDFNGTNGKAPHGSLVISGSVLYGITAGGGANSDGVVFSINTDGTGYKDMLDFDGSNGQVQWGSFDSFKCIYTDDAIRRSK